MSNSKSLIGKEFIDHLLKFLKENNGPEKKSKRKIFCFNELQRE
jgi:hypothetical protein